MGTEPDGRDHRAVSPDEAFSVLGDETRLEILRRLGEADEPLSFSELYNRIDYDGGGNFSYHLKKLTGHFVRETDRAKWDVAKTSSMTADHETDEPDVAPSIPSGDRSTAPQSEYTLRQVATGVGVLLVGLVLTFGVALAL